MSLRWEGIDAAIAQLGRLGDRVSSARPTAAEAGMTHIEAVSVELVPVESGVLVGSRKVTVEGNTAALSYGTPYARYQHERMDLRHEHGQAKFLEQPIRTETDAALAEAARVLRRAAGG